MNKMDLIKARHSVRQYLDKPLEHDKISVLQSEIKKCNQKKGKISIYSQ